MKKFLLSILTLVYFAISVRANVHMHDCMDELEKYVTDKSCKQENKACPKENIKDLHLDTYQKISKRAIYYSSLSTLTIISVVSHYWPEYFYTVKEYWPQTTPSFLTLAISLLVLFCILRI